MFIVFGYKFYLKNNILIKLIYEKNVLKDLEKENLYREFILYGGFYLVEDFFFFLLFTLVFFFFIGVVLFFFNVVCFVVFLVSFLFLSVFNFLYSFL